MAQFGIHVLIIFGGNGGGGGGGGKPMLASNLVINYVANCFNNEEAVPFAINRSSNETHYIKIWFTSIHLNHPVVEIELIIPT